MKIRLYSVDRSWNLSYQSSSLNQLDTAAQKQLINFYKQHLKSHRILILRRIIQIIAILFA